MQNVLNIKEMEQFNYILERLNEQKDILTNILVQTTKTNGRVVGLEDRMSVQEKNTEKYDKKIDSLTETKNVNKGRDTVIWVIIMALAGICGFVISHYISLK